jgi:quercetin dioxygenase-like cupin family protein
MIAHQGPRFRSTTLDAIEELPVVGGTLRWKPVRRTLGIQAFGTNAYVGDAGQDVIEDHTEGDGTEEMYVVVRGHARFTVDGEDLDAPAGTIVFLPVAEARRKAVAVQDGTTVLAVGGIPGRGHEISEWEERFYQEGRERLDAAT